MDVKLVADGIFRGPRPQTIADVFVLKGLGIGRIINLQGENIFEDGQVNDEAAWCSSVGLLFKHVPMGIIEAPKASGLVLNAVLLNSWRNNVYVHCHDGVDRTGMTVAAYRILYDEWTVGRAAQEMIDGGFHLTPYCFWIERLKGVKNA